MKWKLTVAVSALMAVISVLMASGIYSYMKRDYLAGINRNRSLVVGTLATSAFEALLREDMSSIAFLGEQFGRQADVRSVLVMDQGDKVVYDSMHRLEGKLFKEVMEGPYSRPISLDGEEAIEILVPFMIGDTKWASARVVYSMAPVNEETSLIFKTISLIGLLGIAMGMFASSVLARWITLPIGELTKGMNAVEKGDLDYRIRIESRDELEMLGNEFNSMAERLKEVQGKLIERGKELETANQGLFDREKDLASKNLELLDLNNRLQTLVTELEESNKKLKDAQAELMEKEKMAAILELAGAAAHEMNQPLTVIIGNIDLLLSQEGLDETMARNTLEIVNRAARELAAIVKKMSRIRRYETDAYVGKVRILDLERSSKE